MDGFYDNSGAPYGYITASSNDLARFLKFMMYGGDLLSKENHDLLIAEPKVDRSYGLF